MPAENPTPTPSSDRGSGVGGRRAATPTRPPNTDDRPPSRQRSSSKLHFADGPASRSLGRHVLEVRIRGEAVTLQMPVGRVEDERLGTVDELRILVVHQHAGGETTIIRR